MRISLQWLSKFVKIPEISGQEIAKTFTVHTAEVEEAIEEGKIFENMVLGKVVSMKPHPNADKLKIALTDIGSQKVQIVCGGVNLAEGMMVAVALPGARVKWHGEGELITLEKTAIRGEESFGMICAGEEIGMPAGGEHEIMSLKTKKTPGTPLAEVFKKNDVILEIDNKSLTHRPDLWGHYGIAREFSAIFKTKLKPYEKGEKIATLEDFGNKKILTIEIQDKKICPRFAACIVTNVKIQESPQWLKRDLLAVGIRPVNNVVDVTNHVMMGLGQPMHAFDRKIVGDHLIVKSAEKNAKFETLDHKIRTLSDEDVVVANPKETLSIAGIMGGKNSEINSETTEIIFEAANWNPTLIRRTSTRHMLRTDAVQRFEKSLDPALAEIAIRRACTLLKQICPSAKIEGSLVDIKNYEEKTTLVEVDIERTQQKIGAKIPGTEMVKILKSLQFKAKKEGKKLFIEVPSWRATKDVAITEDIGEEIARMYGYAKLPVILPELAIAPPRENKDRALKHHARDILSLGLGFTEVYNYSFYSERDLKNALLAEETHLKLKNYLSEDQTHMRVSLVPNLLKNIAQNLRFFEQFKIYEIGHTYQEIKEYFPSEEKWICSAIVSKDENIFSEAKGVLEAFLEKFGSQTYEKRDEMSYCPYAHPKKFLAYEYESANEFARVFELHPIVKKNFGLEKANIAIFEINLNKLITNRKEERRYESIPKFPGIEIDVSVLIDDQKKIKDLEKVMNVSPLIKKIRLFDLYSGPNIESGKKSATFKILLQSEEKTLTDEEMKKVQTDIFKNLQEAGGTIRGL
ncbi:MAG: phenylalanine--tRNA ligase subunit beta [Patescibacteria group bacterium]